MSAAGIRGLLSSCLVRVLGGGGRCTYDCFFRYCRCFLYLSLMACPTASANNHFLQYKSDLSLTCITTHLEQVCVISFAGASSS